MSIEEVTYPEVTVQLTGEDSNAFIIIGLVAKALRRQVNNEAASKFSHEAMEQKSYDDLLRFAMRTVNVN